MGVGGRRPDRLRRGQPFGRGVTPAARRANRVRILRFLDRFDPWFRAILASNAVSYAHLDANGHYAIDWNLPPGLEAGTGISGELGWSFQVMDVATFELSAPYRIRKL